MFIHFLCQQGRSKSLTHIDTLDPSTEVREQEHHPLLGASNSSGSGSGSGDGTNVGGKGHAGMRHQLSGNGGGDLLVGTTVYHPPKNSFQSHDMHHLRGFHAAIQATGSSSPPDSSSQQTSASAGQSAGETTPPTGGGGTAVTAIKQRSRRTKLASSMKVRPFLAIIIVHVTRSDASPSRPTSSIISARYIFLFTIRSHRALSDAHPWYTPSPRNFSLFAHTRQIFT